MNRQKLFDSLTDPVPELRPDLQVIQVEDDGKKLLYFHDAMNYLTDQFALDIHTKPLLMLFDGSQNINQISRRLSGEIKPQALLQFVRLLDSHRALNSSYYRDFREKAENSFESQQDRYPALAGKSYPEKPDELTDYIDELLKPTTSDKKQIHALYAPHIELSIGRKQYGEAFSLLKGKKPSRLIILATSHYSGYYPDLYSGTPFIGSSKKHWIGNRVLEPDLDVIQALSQNKPENGFSIHDRAHRIEHSIEFHLLFASHIWQHNFTVVPILVSGFDEILYHPEGDLAQKIENFTSDLKPFADGNTFILISGDLSHVGLKFGDRKTASELRPDVEITDKQFLDFALSGEPESLRHHLSKDYDATRICGFPPLYTYLKMFPEKSGELLNYFWWDEKERGSAVSFGSIVYS